MATIDVFSRSDVVVIFTYAPAGLGHLRVTDSLYEGLPRSANTHLLGADDSFMQHAHKWMSITPLGVSLQEWFQRGTPQSIVTSVYRKQLHQFNRELYHKCKAIVNQRLEVPKHVVIIATHFALAHQIAVIKDRLEKELNVMVHIVVQVTDDSPQYIWYVPGVDLLVVPSETTKKELEQYAKSSKLPRVDIVVQPYPQSPLLTKKLTLRQQEQRLKQVSPDSRWLTQVLLPVSGAAVGMDFLSDFSRILYRQSHRYRFTVVSRQSEATAGFLRSMKRRQYVSVLSSPQDRTVINLYQFALQQKIMSLEVTKPSEQAFKSLIATDKVGGVIELFSEPVGRQEYDNLAFLERHWLIPSHDEQMELYQLCQDREQIPLELHKRAEFWRGIQIPPEPAHAALFVQWAFRHGLFISMLASRSLPKEFDEHKHELRDDGVKLFWENVAELIEK